MSGGAVVMARGVLAGVDLITRSEVGRKEGRNGALILLTDFPGQELPAWALGAAGSLHAQHHCAGCVPGTRSLLAFSRGCFSWGRG